MKRKIIIFSPLVYSVICLILNIILSILCIVAFYLIFSLYFFLLDYESFIYSIIIGIFFDFVFWFILYMSRNHRPYLVMYLMANCASTCAEAFLYFHKDQKTKELAKGFKLIRQFRSFTSWFWISFLIHKNDKNVQRVFAAFKKFIEVNTHIKKFLVPSIWPNEDFTVIRGFFDEIDNRTIDYIRIEI